MWRWGFQSKEHPPYNKTYERVYHVLEVFLSKRNKKLRVNDIMKEYYSEIFGVNLKYVHDTRI